MIFLEVSLCLYHNLQMKCLVYWPGDGVSVTYGDITVDLLTEDCWPDFAIRDINLTRVRQHTRYLSTRSNSSAQCGRTVAK